MESLPASAKDVQLFCSCGKFKRREFGGVPMTALSVPCMIVLSG